MLLLAGIALWVGAMLLLWGREIRRERRRPSLADRLAPYQQPRIGDEAEEWLRRQ